MRVLGELVAYWAVLAVFAYYFEVIGRYVFNSPTNWVHESTFLMFGMQYMIAGAYAYRGESHVRVDLIYSQAVAARQGDLRPDRLGVLLHLHRHHGVDRLDSSPPTPCAVGEVSFTEWGIQYWPVKLTIPLGAALLLLQGIARLIKDVAHRHDGKAAERMGLDAPVEMARPPDVRRPGRAC